MDYPDRDIATHGSFQVPSDFLQSIFVAELIRPSPRLWICSPWISDVEIIDNTGRQFSSLSPDWPAARIRLSEVLARLLQLGAEIVIIVNESPHNVEFLDRVAPLKELHCGALQIIRAATLHGKGILGEHFALIGSMNLTYGGVYRNEEYLVYRCDPGKVAERRLDLESRWNTELCS